MTGHAVPDVLAERAHSMPDVVFVECGGVRRTFARDGDPVRATRGRARGARRREGRPRRDDPSQPHRARRPDLRVRAARCDPRPGERLPQGRVPAATSCSDAAASVVVGDAEGLAAVDAIRSELPDLEHVLSAEDLPVADAAEPPRSSSTPADTVAIMYTSGTTGMPKGCMIPHGYHTRSPIESNTLLEYGPGDVLYSALPLFHGWARGMLFGALVHGVDRSDRRRVLARDGAEAVRRDEGDGVLGRRRDGDGAARAAAVRCRPCALSCASRS